MLAALPMLFFCLLDGQADALFLLVYAQHDHLHHISYGQHLRGMLHIMICNFRNMHQSILMDTNIHKRSKINDIPNRSGEHHAGLQILYLHNVCPQNGLGQRISDVPAGLHQLTGHIHQSGNTDAQFLGRLFLAITLELL